MSLFILDTKAITPASILIGQLLRLREDCLGPGNEVGVSLD